MVISHFAGLLLPLSICAVQVLGQTTTIAGGLSIPSQYADLSSVLNSMEQQILALQSKVGTATTPAPGPSSTPASPQPTASSSSALPPKASTAVTVGNETMLVGQLVGSSLNSSVISALAGICGDNGCDSTVAAASIPSINYGVAGTDSVQTGTLEMTITSSHYTGTAERDAMINLIASSLTLTATGSNCKNISYTQGCTKKRTTIAERRAEGYGDIEERADENLEERALGPNGSGGTSSSCETHTVLTCSGSNNIGVQIVDTANENALLGIMDFSATFAGSTVPFDCGDFIDSITAWLGPFKEAADIVEALGDVSAACGYVSAAAGVVGGST